jgi:lysophospholipase L1-like esterase
VAASGFVYYDENANGQLDSNEVVRIPGVTVSIGGRSGTSSSSGRFTVADAPTGGQSLTVGASSLPPYFVAAASQAVQLPASGDIPVPLTLPIGNRYVPNLYLGFGDSITADGGAFGQGYLVVVEAEVRNRWGKAAYASDGEPGSKSNQGAARMAGTLQSVRPAYTLILYGTNDWTKAECKDTGPSCFTVESLRFMVQTAKQYGSMPVLATIPPVNPSYADKGATERNAWVKAINVQVRAMASQEHCAVADVYAAFPQGDGLAALFADDVHPTEQGHHLIGEAFFQAITGPPKSSATS